MPNQHILINNGASDWKIVVGDKASKSEIYASNELQKYLLQISGVRIPIICDSGDLHKREIIIGDNNHRLLADYKMELEELGDEGFVIKMSKDYLVISGGKLRGTLYGVYTFLEKYLGCRWFSHNASSIPQKSIIELPDIYDRQTPKIGYRECYYDYQALNGDRAARNKLNGHFHELEEKHGKKVKYSHFVHTFDELVPVEKYFSTHPEYFAEIDGSRTDKETQLCLTNSDVFEIALASVRKWIEEDRDCLIFSVSQNDCPVGRYNYCECENCRKLDEAEESHCGTLLYFVNKIAEAVAKDYPHVFIDTLAYQYSRKPPKTIRPAKNVIIRLCSIECCFSHPMETCHEVCALKKTSETTTFLDDLKRWAQICDNIFIWDYIVNFAHYIMPFPNFQVLKPNIQFFIKNNVKGIFEQGNYSRGSGGEFAELRSYVVARLLWNPDEDVDLLINDFLNGFYGRAAAPIRSYIDLLSKKVINENIHMGIYDTPTAPYLSKDIIEKADELFDTAEILAENEVILERVRLARLPVKYVKIKTMQEENADTELIVKEFYAELKNAGVTQLIAEVPFTMKDIVPEGTKCF